MHGVSEVIAIILILMITIAIAGLAYTFMSSTMASTTSYASSAVDTTTSSMMTSFTIENIDIAKVYIRNTGQNTIASLSVYVNDEPAIFNVTPLSIASGQVGTITIYSFIPVGATIKINSLSGFSASKVANPCDKAIGCWKFDEGSGLIAYDSSPFGNNGLISGAVLASGKYGNAVNFDGSDDYVNGSISTILSSFTISGWIKIGRAYPGYIERAVGLVDLGRNASYNWYRYSSSLNFSTAVVFDDGTYAAHYNSNVGDTNVWFYVVCVYNSTHFNTYINGFLKASTAISSKIFTLTRYDIGREPGGYNFNGAIDEFRIYNRAIY